MSRSLYAEHHPLYQYGMHEVFKCLIKCEYPVARDDGAACNKAITREEENALRYVAGYICRKVCDKLQASSLPHMYDLILCIHDNILCVVTTRVKAKGQRIG